MLEEGRTLEDVSDCTLSSATIFLLGDIDLRGQEKEYDAKMEQVERKIREGGFTEMRRLVTGVTSFVNPRVVDHRARFYRKIAVLYAYGRSCQGERLSEMGIVTPTLAEIVYCYRLPDSPNSSFYEDVFTMGEVVSHARSFLDLDVDLLLVRDIANIEKGKILMTRPIFEQLEAKGYTEQVKPFWVEGNE